MKYQLKFSKILSLIQIAVCPLGRPSNNLLNFWLSNKWLKCETVKLTSINRSVDTARNRSRFSQIKTSIRKNIDKNITNRNTISKFNAKNELQSCSKFHFHFRACFFFSIILILNFEKCETNIWYRSVWALNRGEFVLRIHKQKNDNTSGKNWMSKIER